MVRRNGSFLSKLPVLNGFSLGWCGTETPFSLLLLFKGLGGRQQSSRLSLYWLSLATLGLLGLNLLADRHHATVSAAPQGTQIATGSLWKGASFPVENFQAYTSAFGYRSSADGGDGQEFHYGLDLAAPEGSYIRSWWTGKVVEVTDGTNCGTSVVIESGSWRHIYCHMSGHVESGDRGRYLIDRAGAIQIWEGQMVRAGTRIGRVGMTGRTTGPHLHWGLKFEGQWVDPALVLREMYVQQARVSG